MHRPATLQDVAERAGVHRSTVSLALRDHPRISEEVRLRVRRIALELGYRANPLVTALMQSRRTRSEARHVALAYVTCYPTRYGWRPPHHDRPDYFPGAARRAEELGYKLEDFWFAEPSMTPDRFAQILRNRGINGLLIGRLPPGQTSIDLPWARFSAVALGLTLQMPNLHRVSEDAFASAHEAMARCIARGHRRIGFVFSEANDSPGIGERYLGAYFGQQLKLAPDDRIPPCDFCPAPYFPAHFRSWFTRTQPDAIIATHAEPVAALLKDMPGAPVPVIALINDKLPQGYAGMHLDPAILGAQAVDMVVGMMHRGETGLPANPHHILVPAQWVEGSR